MQNHPPADEFIRRALLEDAPFGDITTEACIPGNAVSFGRFIVKAPGVICGLELAERVFELAGGGVQTELLAKDGDFAEKGAVIMTVSGSSRVILTAERIALNIMQHLSGVATATRAFAEQVAGTTARVIDTRKTTPGFRTLEKYAVRCGGGANHRFSLSDGVLLKDNHIKAAGGIKNAVAAAKRAAPHTLKIEVECETQDEVLQAIDAGADIIMLDNMSCADMTAAVTAIGGRALTEASGNMDEKNLREVAACGVDFISIGALTHSVKALDISLKFE
ncbi:MAG: carboxylating nicotinate-nucleotide diphosphorylase [Oscillospiraceae bacterium]|jgi:nicotinate-nucleotide pyrophosphorylase (carboxylating)|nr:carboxylating nicotinate-nucleotide diphosphorylase [Oscillospiraceae bacterium]